MSPPMQNAKDILIAKCESQNRNALQTRRRTPTKNSGNTYRADNGPWNSNSSIGSFLTDMDTRIK